jgi:hypothetical protein
MEFIAQKHRVDAVLYTGYDKSVIRSWLDLIEDIHTSLHKLGA